MVHFGLIEDSLVHLIVHHRPQCAHEFFCFFFLLPFSVGNKYDPSCSIVLRTKQNAISIVEEDGR